MKIQNKEQNKVDQALKENQEKISRRLLKTVKGQILASTVGIILLISIFSFLVSHTMVTRSVNYTMDQLLPAVVSSTTKAVDNSLKQHHTLAETLAISDILTNPEVSVEAKVEILKPYPEEHGYFAMAYVLPNGELLSTKGIRANGNTNEAIVGALAGKTTMAGPTVNTATGNINFFLGVPVYNDGKVIGALCSTMTDDQMSKITEGIDLGEGSEIVVLDSKGNVIASNVHPDYVTNLVNVVEEGKANDNLLGLVAAFDQATVLGKGIIREVYNSEASFLAYAPIEGTDWTVYAITPEKDYVKVISNNQMTMGVMVCVFVLLGIFLANRVANKVARPIDRTVDRMVALSEGNLSDDVEICTETVNVEILSTTLKMTITHLNEYISDIKHVLAQMAEGNLHVTSGMTYQGDFKEIQVALHQIGSSLNRTLYDINEASGQVAIGAEHISSGSQNLSTSSANQAEHIGRLNDNALNVSQSASGNLAIVEEAIGLAFQAKTQADQGSAKMGEMVAAMNDINASSHDISKIIKVIDDIAFQTNILALNAAVEAARAGNAGKGFAVVAEEVRNLASKSAEAAKETTELLQTSINKTTQGNKTAKETAKFFTAIVDVVDEVSKMMDKIEKTFQEEVSMIDEISVSVDEINAIAQENSASAQESAATSEELYAQSQSLKSLVDAFDFKKTF